MEQKPDLGNFGNTISDLLDRLEVKVEKIGSNTPETAVSVLTGLDEVTERIDELENESSRRVVSGQFESITGRLRADAGAFVHDMGGARALQLARDSINPPQERWWWYLDAYVGKKRKNAVRRLLVFSGAFILSLVILGLVYKFFLAPDPQVLARYTHEQNARDAMTNGSYEVALNEIQQGLSIAPNDPALLILRGVIEEAQGQSAAADRDYAQAQAGYTNKEEFFLARGQAYLLVKLTDRAIADTQEVLKPGKSSSSSAQAYLLAGQAYEDSKQYQQALEAYNNAFEAADTNKQNELAAISRTKIAMLMQLMSGGVTMPAETPTSAPTK